jgi:GNAT superfamily N-acetyltransferase
VRPTDCPAVELRRARHDEAQTIADLYWDVRRANLATIPPVAHTHDEICRWAEEILLPRHDVWVAAEAQRIVGFLALGRAETADAGWVEQLYVHPAYAGQGLGTRLLDLAKRELGGAVQLWTFQSNTGARRFYARHGFDEVEWTDGDNEEGAPDVRMLYTPTEP